MLHRFHILFLSFLCPMLAIGMSACKKQDKSELLINQAKEAAAKQEFQKAKLLIDSIRILYPDDYHKIQKGRHALYEVELGEQKRNRYYCDSVLKIRQADFPQKQKNFTYQQNTAIESVGYYVHNEHVFHGNNTQRCYLQFKTDNEGRYFLTSYYCNTYPIEHSKIRLVAPDGSYCESLEVPNDGALNYRFRDDNLYYEIVCFNQKKLNKLMEFAHLHKDDNLKVLLVGKRKHQYPLRSKDLQIMLDGMELSFVLSDIHRLLEESRLSQAKIQYLKQRIEQVDSTTKKLSR